MYRIPRRYRIGNARENSSVSTYRAGPANVLSRAKPQKSHAALQTFVTETSQTAGSTRSRIGEFALHLGPRDCTGHLVIDWIANDRAGHAVPAAAAAPELGARDRDHLDALFPQQRIGVHVAVIREDDARRGANEVGAAVPLGALA